jgi:hypothetical protein
MTPSAERPERVILLPWGRIPERNFALRVPHFTRRDVQAATTLKALAHGQELAAQVEDLDWDEYSVWGCLPGEGIVLGELAVHHAFRPLAGECLCQDDFAAKLCAHMVAVASAFLDDTGL